MQPFEGGIEMTSEEILSEAENLLGGPLHCHVEGVTILGGEPFEQAVEAAELALAAHKRGLGVVVFTGYTLSQLQSRGAPEGAASLLAHTDLLIDGPYIEEQASMSRRYIGSDNQRVIHLTDRYKSHPDLAEPDTQGVHIELGPDGVTVTGWPPLVEQLLKPC
jgi:anaerobic ribonucleoside-triphosphate reductase activating protein